MSKENETLGMSGSIVYIGNKVYHKDIYGGKELMEIVGIRKDTVELEGDYSGGTHNVCQKDWLPIEGLIPIDAQSDAVEFIQWVEKNNYWADEYEDDMITKLDCMRWSNNSPNPQNYTTEQLYQLFKQQNP